MFVRRIWPSVGDDSLFRPTRLLRDFERLLDAATRETGEPRAGVFPALNINRDAANFYVRAELPGVSADALTITTEGSKLSLSGCREIPAEEGHVSYHRRERASGSFSRTIVLPHDVDSERVDAHYADGILTITLPLSERAKAKQITVRTA
jgi:HSP20 family protein